MNAKHMTTDTFQPPDQELHQIERTAIATVTIQKTNSDNKRIWLVPEITNLERVRDTECNFRLQRLFFLVKEE